MSKTYSTLFPQVVSEINKRSGREIITTDSRYAVQPAGIGGSLDSRSLAEVITTIASDLADLIEPYIISGFDVTAESPPSDSVLVEAGTCISNGRKWEIETDTTLKIPFDSSTHVFYICVYNNAFEINRTHDSTKCEICKIIVPRPGTTSRIVDDKPSDGYDAYIVSAKDAVYKEEQEFDDASVEKLRDVIGDVLADNIIGNLRLSENMKILNTSGTLELNSQEVKFLDVDENVLANFKPTGLYFYNVSGAELAKFTTAVARIGSIAIFHDRLQSTNFSEGLTGFRIKSSGDVEFNNATFRGILYATSGEIGGFTIASNKLYGGTIQTDANVAAGTNGVIMDSAGLRVYDDILGLVVNLPSDGSAPSFASGTITDTIFEIQTNAVIRTSTTVGDGSASSFGLLMNNSGLYGCGTNQILTDANFKVLSTGNAYFKGEVQATSGQIGNVSITLNGLYGGFMQGTLVRASTIESSAGYPKIRIDENGIYYMVTSATGLYGTTYSYGDGTLYGAGVLAYLFNVNYPVISIISEQDYADIRLYNRSDPPSAAAVIGDIACIDNRIHSCVVAGTPGTFVPVGTLENRTSDPASPVTGQMWIRTDL